MQLLTAAAMWPYAFPEESAKHELRVQAAAQAAEGAVEIATRLRRPILVSAALDALSSVWVQEGDWGRVEEVTDRRVAMVDEVDDPWELGDIYAVSAWGAFHRGRYRAAHELAVEGGRRVAGEFPAVHVHTQAWAVVASFRLGEWERALLEFEILRDLLGDRRDEPPYFASRPFGWLAVVHEVRGEPAAADRLVAVLDNLGTKPAFELAFTGSRIPVARVLARRGEGEAARKLLHFDPTHGHPSRGIAMEILCDVLIDAWDFSEAARLLPAARVQAQENGLVALPVHADRLEGAVALDAGDLETAIACLARARDGFAGLEARWEQACTELLLGRALAGAGDVAGAHAAAQRALPVHEELRSLREAGAARELLAL